MPTNEELVSMLTEARQEIHRLKVQAATLPPDDAAALLATLDDLTERSREIARAMGH